MFSQGLYVERNKVSSDEIKVFLGKYYIHSLYTFLIDNSARHPKQGLSSNPYLEPNQPNSLY
jgi:hypothetical protein